MPVNHISDYIVINQGGTPGTAGTGAYFVASLSDVFNPALSSAASADPLTLTAYEGSIVWHAGAPFIWNGTAYEAVRAAGAAAGDDARFQVSATAPTLRADGSALVAGDLWSDTTNDVLMIYDGAAYVAIGGGAAGGNSVIVDNGDNTITHTSGSGAVVTLMKAPTHVAAPAAPTTPFIGDTWYDTVNSKLFKRINDGTADVWQDITGGAAAAPLAANYQVFTADGVWTKPAGVSMVYVQVWGGGGSGSVNAWQGDPKPAYGGGGGGYTATFIDASSLPATVNVVVGAGGASVSKFANANETDPTVRFSMAGNHGGDSSFGAVIARGGRGGQTGGGAGGNGEIGTGGLSGAGGAAPDTGGNVGPGGYNASMGGAGGGDVRFIGVGPSPGGISNLGGNGGAGGRNNGVAGSAPGGGGGGAHVGGTSGTATSGPGARGEVRVWAF